MRNFKTTGEIKVPESLIDQVIGQEKAVEIIKKSARQKRNVLLIGSPGTGKSMLAQAMAEIMPIENLEDVLVYPNSVNENQPIARVVPTYPDSGFLSKKPEYRKYYSPLELSAIKKYSEEGKTHFLPDLLRTGLGRRVIQYRKPQEEMGPQISPNLLVALIGLVLIAALFFAEVPENTKWLLLATTIGIGFLFMLSGLAAGMQKRIMPFENPLPKLIVDNTGNKNAPFVDATGSKAGALLGDVKHDPLQCFFPLSTIYNIKNERIEAVKIKGLVDALLSKYANRIERNENYEGLVLPENEELYTLGYAGSEIKPVRITCVNRRIHNGKMQAVKSGANRVVLTPEHKVYVDGKYIEAANLGGNEALVSHSQPIITRDDVIRTFSEQEQKDVYNYYSFVKIKDENPHFGYKKIAKMLRIKAGQTRWWNNKRCVPNPVKTIERLKKAGLLPFTFDNKNAPIAARVLGTTFGDGGIFSTLNGIFLSSSEQDSIDDYARDMMAIFGEGIGKNFERRISGVNNTGMVVWNTNRDVVRFFAALGAPVGRKNKELKLPAWVHLNPSTEREFFGSLLGNELCSPRFCPKQNKIQYFGIGLAGGYSLKENRLKILNEIAHYLNSYGVKTSAAINQNEYREGRYVWRLGISCEIENVMRFYSLIPVRYSNAKSARIQNSIETTLERKRTKYEEFVQLGKSGKYTNATLRVSEAGLQKIITGNELDFAGSAFDFSGFVYNVTTESGNLFANGILVSNSGGLGTPAHLRVESGAVHKANKGVLFIDEIASLKYNWQQELLTAMQEKKYFITGQSDMSSGALVKTEPVPSDFVLVAAGNLPDMQHIHPALRSRIRGSGYEVYMEDSMEDNDANRDKLVQFVAQEIKRDGKIPHFTRDAVMEIMEEGRRMSGRKGHLTMNLRELGGLCRAAGDVAREEGAEYVLPMHVEKGKKTFTSVEFQLSKKIAERKKDYKIFANIGFEVGKVNGLAVLGDSLAGLVLPIAAEVTPSASKSEGRVIATGKLGQIAKEAVDNVSAILKKYESRDISQKDIHIQFLQTYEGVEGDSASISIAVAVISALEGIPIDQSCALTGSLSVRGEVLPVGGINGKIEAAIDAGMKKVIIPKANWGDVYIAKERLKMIEIIPVSNIAEVLENVLAKTGEKKKLVSQIKKESGK